MSLLIICALLTFHASAGVCYNPYNHSVWVPGHHGYHGFHSGQEHAQHFVGEWTVSLDGDEEIAQLVAREFGYAYGGRVAGYHNTYSFLKYEHEKQRRAPNPHISAFVKDRRVKWAEQLFLKSRVKRDYPVPDPDRPLHRVKRMKLFIDFARRIRSLQTLKRPLFNDELWGHQWYLQDTRTLYNLPRLDLNVLPVYKMGYNGSGVRVSVLDDGIEYNHTDLRANYDPEISWDCNDNDPDPVPRYEKTNLNSHGTRCAGEIAMTANNRKCGVGVAWGARIGGVRMLDGAVTDKVEGEAIGFAWDKVDIYSSSWGPDDDGKTVEGPGRLAMEAIERGINKGRAGKGTIYVWANGNGGRNKDNCNCDGYSSSIYTISIGSASQHGLFPWYGEICSSTLATAYSSGAYRDQKIATTDTFDTCTVSHTGTSAAAPLAAGIIALALHANPNLTWRDVQHLIVWTSEYAPLSANPGWQKNGVGLRFDVRFGFGLLNAGSLVTAALNWTTVPEKFTCEIEVVPLKNGEGRVSSGEILEIPIIVDNCVVNYIEHVELIVNIDYKRRGALEIDLTSPQGTKVPLLSARIMDKSTKGFVNWPLTSVATWGESPNGIWKVTFQDETGERNAGEVGPLNLVIHGISEMPAHMKSGPRKYIHHDTDYEEIFNYIDNDVIEKESLDSDDTNVLEEHNTEQVNINNIDPTILAKVEIQLQRIHHRMAFIRPPNQM